MGELFSQDEIDKVIEDIKSYWRDDTSDNLCNSCATFGYWPCDFVSGMVKTKCAFYMPPRIEPDNCGNYVVQPTYEARLKADTVVILDKIRAEITAIDINGQVDEHTMFIRTGEQVKQMVLKIIDKYKAESEEQV